MTCLQAGSCLKNAWRHNTAVRQLLGLCPLMAVTTTAVNGFLLGCATLCVLTGSNTLISCLRQFIPGDIRLPLFMLIISSWVSLILLLLQAMSFALYQELGLFLALITTNCVLLARANIYAHHQGILASMRDGCQQGFGFLGILTLLGAVRELLGTGSLFSQAHAIHTILPAWLVIPAWTQPLRLAILAPGGFFLFAMLLALIRGLTHEPHAS